jgi:hypothetical protein
LPALASTVSVAPRRAREVELPRHRVDGDDAAGPAIRQPWTTESPMPPQPMTATVLPAGPARG